MVAFQMDLVESMKACNLNGLPYGDVIPICDVLQAYRRRIEPPGYLKAFVYE